MPYCFTRQGTQKHRCSRLNVKCRTLVILAAFNNNLVYVLIHRRYFNHTKRFVFAINYNVWNLLYAKQMLILKSGVRLCFYSVHVPCQWSFLYLVFTSTRVCITCKEIDLFFIFIVNNFKLVCRLLQWRQRRLPESETARENGNIHHHESML